MTWPSKPLFFVKLPQPSSRYYFALLSGCVSGTRTCKSGTDRRSYPSDSSHMVRPGWGPTWRTMMGRRLMDGGRPRSGAASRGRRTRRERQHHRRQWPPAFHAADCTKNRPHAPHDPRVDKTWRQSAGHLALTCCSAASRLRRRAPAPTCFAFDTHDGMRAAGRGAGAAERRLLPPPTRPFFPMTERR